MTQPAGWYADPSGLPARRWWDGSQWTDHIQPGGAPMPPPNGYFPPVPPSGPATPGAHTDKPEQFPLYASQPAAFQQSGPPAGPIAQPAAHPDAPVQHPETPTLHPDAPAPPPKAPAPHPEVPTEPYTIPPVDAVPLPIPALNLTAPDPGTPGPTEPGPAAVDSGFTRQQRTAGFIGLILIAVLVLALTAVILLA
ncbi:DUF2510 domain-containing protein [Actinoplanes derwentensis]|uniref:DUF2510 domain-containing protein n=1 Tax=Actinoplanes derwentensis TaxID=113562 RepID=A0A1H2AMQ9_9ACTN|nr:DUF2510 domain-containing protein [Actinoplanes derwentensis]GID89292.1 hypothetical protein Ade03nite_82160 [Actinoplanes derwentensis]SDT47062.1 Protein of unknown function [Actinoplanes derwentensis]